MRRNPYRQVALPSLLFAGDLLFAFAGLALAWWLRYSTRVGQLGLPVPGAVFNLYLPLLLVGVALLVATYTQLGLYDERLLLRPAQALAIVIKGTAFWLLAYLGISLVLKFEPPISRLFVIVGFATVVLLVAFWRALFYSSISHGASLERIRLRAVILGWTPEAEQLVAEVSHRRAHPLEVIGLVSEAPGLRPDPRANLPALVLGDLGGLETILRLHRADLLIVTHLDFPPPVVQAITEACERSYVELKVIPSVFQIFVSGLRMQTVGTVPLLGVEELPITRLFHRFAKRGLDVLGALAGLLLSAPLLGVLAALIRRESPGPVFFAQERVGLHHRPFTMWKLRSMRPDAAAQDHVRQSTAAGDPRLLRIGRFLRRWNLDELPQFWNVLRGEMSLVGPRPERSYHVDRLSTSIPHYLPRHLVKPGMTGWAQVNGLRGDCDLARRIQYDIYYIENWSPWLDLQIVLFTLVRWRNPAE